MDDVIYGRPFSVVALIIFFRLCLVQHWKHFLPNSEKKLITIDQLLLDVVIKRCYKTSLKNMTSFMDGPCLTC